MRRQLESVVLLGILFLVFMGVRPVSAACGDISYVPSTPVQLYAPVTIQVQFIFTRSASGHATPYGFSKEAPVTTDTTYVRFTTSVNDTYDLWFLVRYDLPVKQNITLTIQEGSRQPTVLPLCMNGQTAYFHWTSIQVSQEPHEPTPAETWGYGNYQLSNMLGQTLDAIGGLSGGQFWTDMGFIPLYVLVFALVIGLWKMNKKIRGTA